MIGKWFLRVDAVVDVVRPVPGRRRYADQPTRPGTGRPATRTDRADRRGGNGGRYYLL
ncbi:hypothetical protein O7621_11375 [Solwaraspora sp. WMMD937]|uniref:hypothetical protein n=1 Tax=Solwaraspora sp. WMMD937 TaxID=3016090 RepID=UPI00249B9CD0|nr:hypothetical protein [Solwaraspora sp. WMMD937]WFE23811.1 hypothetical protein O7621_11375 [Solwaraspora sp. WMMD937]